MKRIISIMLSLVLLVGSAAATSAVDDGADYTTTQAVVNVTNHVLTNTDKIPYYKNGVNAVFINASERTTDIGVQRLQAIKQENENLPVFAVVDYSDDLEQYKNTITQIVKQGYDGVLLKNVKYDNKTQKQLLNTFKQENKDKQLTSSQNNTLQTNIEFKKWQAEKLTEIVNESAIEAKRTNPDALVGVYLYGVESGQNPIEILRLESVDLIIPAKGDATGEVAFLTGPIEEFVDWLTQPLKDAVCSLDPTGLLCRWFGSTIDWVVDSVIGDFISVLDTILGFFDCSVPIGDVVADATGLLVNSLTMGYLDQIPFLGGIVQDTISDVVCSFVCSPMEDALSEIRSCDLDDGDITPPTLEGCNGSEFVWYTKNASISPADSDGILDYVRINVSQFTESVNYILRIKQNDTVIRPFTGWNTTTINESWHGNSTNGTMVDDGIYTVELFASDLAGNNITKTLGYVTVDNTPPYFTTVPALSTNIISPTTSPGINDSTTITANFSEPVGWKICAINSTNDVVSVGWCGGMYLQTSWNGTSSGFNTSMECQNMSYNSISEECDVIRITSCPPPRRGGGGGGGTYPTPWQVFPDGEYAISIIATDWVGNNVSYALQVTLSDSDANLRGDLNDDDEITLADCVIVLQIAVGSREYDHVADVNDDGKVTSLDALMIMQAASGAIEL